MIKNFRSIKKIIRERLKVIYYNLKQPGYKFRLENKNYLTQGQNWSIKTFSPLYFITKEIDRYERFYQVKPNDVIIDAGAFHGILSLVYSKKAVTGRVYSFEPDYLNLESLKKNLSLNDNPKNIHVIEKALWYEESLIKFYQDGSVASSTFYKAENAIEKKIEALSLDVFAHKFKISELNFIKMDVEGAELSILKGAIEILSRFKPNLSIASYHIVDGALTYKSLEEFFQNINFPYKTIFYPDGEIITYAGPAVQDIN
ncbi:FkbM family methyltransferase [uncultured Christiangramia sp.]|uniref:FkbM family methyltransferase n=1 Tax=uncultured Christiangramia sp. TaxID=503836 RepID=UPI0026115E9F|nr:FkbM family methyltransferase [uncultured Christiangramia sp.]